MKKVIKMAILLLIAVVIYLGSILLGINITGTSGGTAQTSISCG